MSIQSELAQESKCFCFNDATERAVVVYLLLSKTGLLNMTPSQLAVAAKAYSYDLDPWKKIVAYLLAVDAGLQGDTPKQLADAAKCYCFDEGTWKKVVAFLLASGGSGGPCPQDMQIAWTPTNLKLAEVSGFISFNNGNAGAGITTLTFSTTTSADGYDIELWPDLQEVHFPSLVSCTSPSSATFYFALDPALVTIDAPVLQAVEATCGPEQCVALVSFSLPSLVTAGNVKTKNCSSLVTVSLPNWLPTNGSVNDLSGCALSVASVNHVLSRGIANAGYVSGTINLGGQTPAAPPSGQGIADKAALILRGVTVITD